MTNEQKLQIAAYRKAGMGYKQIAKELDLSANSVKSYCRRNGLSNEALEQRLPESACENCGKSIEQKKGKKKKRFCSDKCRNQWWNSHLDQVKRKAVYEFISYLWQVFFGVWECKKEILQSRLLCNRKVWDSGKKLRILYPKVVAIFQTLREYTTT